MKGTEKAFAEVQPISLKLVLVTVWSSGGGRGLFGEDDSHPTDLVGRRIRESRDWEAAILAQPQHGNSLSVPFSEFLLIFIKVLATLKGWVGNLWLYGFRETLAGVMNIW